MRFSGSSKWNFLLNPLIEMGDLEFTCFEFTTVEEIPRAAGNTPPSLGTVTKEVMRDLEEYWRQRTERLGESPREISDTQLLSVKIITQNQYLHVDPRIIKVPADAK